MLTWVTTSLPSSPFHHSHPYFCCSFLKQYSHSLPPSNYLVVQFLYRFSEIDCNEGSYPVEILWLETSGFIIFRAFSPLIIVYFNQFTKPDKFFWVEICIMLTLTRENHSYICYTWFWLSSNFWPFFFISYLLYTVLPSIASYLIIYLILVCVPVARIYFNFK